MIWVEKLAGEKSDSNGTTSMEMFLLTKMRSGELMETEDGLSYAQRRHNIVDMHNLLEGGATSVARRGNIKAVTKNYFEYRDALVRSREETELWC